jgi:HTH-type transcriptional regulator, dimethyl sulfoxide reductase transcription regulator
MQDVRIKVNFDHNLMGKISELHNVEIKVLRCSARENGGGTGFFRVDTEDSVTGEEVVRWVLKEDPTTIPSCTTISPGRHLLIMTNENCRVCRTFSGTRCIMAAGHSAEGGAMVWNVITPDPESLRAFIQELRSTGASVELLRVRRHTPRTELTKEQDNILREAMHLGYFEVPKGITLQELAKRKNVSKSTMNLIIRRAQRKVITSYCGND